MDYRKEYTRWCALAKGLDADVEQELAAIRGEEEKIQDAFYRDLAFGTGGLRGVIGAGTNRMNVYTVAKASQGLANYVRKRFAAADRRIAVSRDSRIKSDLFAETAAVFSLKYPLYLVYHAINKKAIFFTNYRFPSARCGCCFLCRGALPPPYCRENKSERRNRGMRGWAPVVVFSLCSGMVFPKVITKILRTFLNFPFQYGE